MQSVAWLGWRWCSGAVQLSCGMDTRQSSPISRVGPCTHPSRTCSALGGMYLSCRLCSGCKHVVLPDICMTNQPDGSHVDVLASPATPLQAIIPAIELPCVRRADHEDS